MVDGLGGPAPISFEQLRAREAADPHIVLPSSAGRVSEPVARQALRDEFAGTGVTEAGINRLIDGPEAVMRAFDGSVDEAGWNHLHAEAQALALASTAGHPTEGLQAQVHAVEELQKKVAARQAAYNEFVGQVAAGLDPAQLSALQTRFEQNTPELAQLDQARSALAARLTASSDNLARVYATYQDQDVITHAFAVASDPQASLSFSAAVMAAPNGDRLADAVLERVALPVLQASLLTAIAADPQNPAAALEVFQQGSFGHVLARMSAAGSPNAARTEAMFKALEAPDPVAALRALTQSATHSAFDQAISLVGLAVGASVVQDASANSDYTKLACSVLGTGANLGAAVQLLENCQSMLPRAGALAASAGFHLLPWVNAMASTASALEHGHLLAETGDDAGHMVALAGDALGIISGVGLVICGLASVPLSAPIVTVLGTIGMVGGAGSVVGTQISRGRAGREVRAMLSDELERQVGDPLAAATLMQAGPVALGRLNQLGLTPQQIQSTLVAPGQLGTLQQVNTEDWAAIQSTLSRAFQTPDGRMDGTRAAALLAGLQDPTGQSGTYSPMQLFANQAREAARRHPTDGAAAQRDLRASLQRLLDAPQTLGPQRQMATTALAAL